MTAATARLRAAYTILRKAPPKRIGDQYEPEQEAEGKVGPRLENSIIINQPMVTNVFINSLEPRWFFRDERLRGDVHWIRSRRTGEPDLQRLRRAYSRTSDYQRKNNGRFDRTAEESLRTSRCWRLLAWLIPLLL